MRRSMPKPSTAQCGNIRLSGPKRASGVPMASGGCSAVTQSRACRRGARTWGTSVSARTLPTAAGAEDALRESEERFRTMADGCPAAMWVTNAEGGIQFINRAYQELVGATFEQVEGTKWQLLIHPDDAPE